MGSIERDGPSRIYFLFNNKKDYFRYFIREFLPNIFWRYKRMIITIILIALVVIICFLFPITDFLTANIVLTISTSTYAILTFLIFRNQKLTNERTLEFIEQQIEISIMPILDVCANTDGTGFKLINIGSKPAYDVEFTVLYTTPSIMLEKYTTNNLKGEKSPRDHYNTSEQFFFSTIINDDSYEDIFLTLVDQSNTSPEFWVVLQFTNIYGKNYVYELKYMKELYELGEYYKLISQEPHSLKNYPRIIFNGPYKTGDETPSFVRQFYDLWYPSSIHLLKNYKK